MNKWFACLFVTASQVATTTGVTAAMIGEQAMLVQQGKIEHATTTGVTAAMIGKQAMLVQQGEIEHPKANGSHTAFSPAQPPNTTCPYGIQINSGRLIPQKGGYTLSGLGTATIGIEFNATAISKDDMEKVDEFMMSALSASEYERYKGQVETSAADVWSLFGLASDGSDASASAKETHDAMSGFGLSEKQQQEILEKIAGFTAKPSTFKKSATVTNPWPYQVNFQMLYYAFVGNIKIGQHQDSKEYIGGLEARAIGSHRLHSIKNLSRIASARLRMRAARSLF